MVLVHRLLVKSATHSYPVYIGTHIRLHINRFLPKHYSSIMVITDDHVAPLYLEDIKKALRHYRVNEVVVPAGEQSKNIHTFYNLHTQALDYGLDRESLIIALGGGVIGDLAGFMAATYMRGIDYIQMPTTILAHDSGIGGKTAINHERGKNLIGSFYPPVAVIYDTYVLHSLDDREKRSGYAELIKEALLRDEDFFNALLNTNVHDLTDKQLVNDLYKGMQIKSAIVAKDERDNNVRQFLNLGHTFAHALEAEVGYGEMTHGEAVALGLLFALHVSTAEFSQPLPYSSLLDWMQRNSYPLDLSMIQAQCMLERMRFDKKASREHIRMVLLANIADPVMFDLEIQKMKRYLVSFLNELSNRT